ncbi:hypothetical protein Tco_1123923 [Tanacetum coccineum]|uniref:Uncharacterized protein n=1 Tax=Tanacetum coccineum TaxID=301880 RepID=A0ABQ5J4Q9_9ASTR
MKAVKEKEQLQKIVDSWKDSSKNLWKLVNYGMTSNSKVGLGYGIKSNNEVLRYEEEWKFICKKDLKKHKTSVLDDKFNEYSTCQSNDSVGSFGNTSEHSVEFESEIISVPKEVSESKVSECNTVRPKLPAPPTNSKHFSPRKTPVAMISPQEHGGTKHVKLVKKVKKMEAVLKRRHVVLTDSEDEDAENSSKQGRNLQKEGLDEMVRSIMKKKSEEFETPTQGKTSGEEDISPMIRSI